MTSKSAPGDLDAATVHDSILGHLSADDVVTLDERLRQERRWYDAAIASFVKEHAGEPANHDLLRDLWPDLREVLERRLASLVPVALYRNQELQREMRALARGIERRPSPGGYAVWADVPQFAAGWLGYVVGALLMRLQREEQVGPLVRAVSVSRYERTTAVVSIHGHASNAFGEVLAPHDHRWLSPAWEFLTRSLEGLPWVVERYPELVEDEGEPRRSMAQFDLMVALAAGARDERSLAYFTLDADGARETAIRLHADSTFRERIATATALPAHDGFIDAARDALSRASDFRGGDSLAVSEVANLIATGSTR